MKLLELAQGDDVAEVIRELARLTPDQRAECAAVLAAHREATWGPQPWAAPSEAYAWWAADLGCQVTPEKTAAWLATLRFAQEPWVVDVLDLYPVIWRRELVTQITVQMAKDKPLGIAHERLLPIAEHLIRDTGCPLPTSADFIHAWLRDRQGWSRPVPLERPAHLLSAARETDVLEWPRTDDWAPTLLPTVLTPSADFREVRCWYWRDLLSAANDGWLDRARLIDTLYADLSDDPWYPGGAAEVLEALALTPAEHARVAADRAVVHDRLIERILQDGTRHETAEPLAQLRALALTPAEYAAVVRDYLALLDRSMPVASHAHEVLVGIDEAGLLTPEILTEAGERVLPRPEKKLVRAHLSWLERIMRREPARVGRLLAEVAMAFEHRDTVVQERALAVVARHLRTAGDSVLPALRSAAERLSPGPATRAGDLLGAPKNDTTAHAGDILPVWTGPRPVPDPAETVAEVAQEVAAVFADDRNVIAFERALDGLVRHARRDRTTLAKALKPLVRREPSFRVIYLYDVVRAVRGDEPRATHLEHLYEPTPPKALLRERAAEAIEIVNSGSQPFLLAVPTLSTGALDAAVLVARIAELEERGVTPAPVDLAQALLRVDPDPDQQVLRAAEGLRSDAGQQLARWLRVGGLPHQDTEPEGWEEEDGPINPVRRGVLPDPPLPRVAAALVGPPYKRHDRWPQPSEPLWLAQMPHHREEALLGSTDVYRFSAFRESARVLPYLVQSGGPAGYGVHLALTFGLACDGRKERDGAVDALLLLAARDQLDGRLLGRQMATLIRRREAAANRVHDSLHAAAETGAPATVWSVLEAALPGLLRGTPPHGTGALLSLAVTCAASRGAKGDIPEVVAVAGRTGSSQLVKNAKLLRDTLR